MRSIEADIILGDLADATLAQLVERHIRNV